MTDQRSDSGGDSEEQEEQVETPSAEEDPLQPLRDVEAGTNDSNIVGDIGPFDKPPGSDPPQEDDLRE